MYEQGSMAISDVVEVAFDEGITYVTLWIASYANLKARPKLEVAGIDRVFERKFDELATSEKIMSERVRVEIIGEWRDLVRPATIAAAERAMTATASHTTHFLPILVGYDGRRERGAAVQHLLRSDVNAPSDFLAAEALLRSHAWTGHLPDVDLLIRTGAWTDPHNSAGFLSFLNSETQFSFPKVLWPDFTPAMLQAVCQEFVSRERRHGK